MPLPILHLNHPAWTGVHELCEHRFVEPALRFVCQGMQSVVVGSEKHVGSVTGSGVLLRHATGSNDCGCPVSSHSDLIAEHAQGDQQ
jgi:hypothetical protein